MAQLRWHSRAHDIPQAGEYPRDKLVRPEGFEPTACGLGNRRSILLSYGRSRMTAAALTTGRMIAGAFGVRKSE